MPRLVKCPTCRQEGNWLEGPYLPFCSKRCKLVDLGKWFSEEHKVSEPLRPDHFKEYEEVSSELDRPEDQSERS